jgi:hypothetical protein
MQQTTLTGKKPAKSSRAAAKYDPDHLTKYGLKVANRNAGTGAVESVVCRFCISFGREEALDALESDAKRRKKTSNPLYFKTFRTDSYLKHLNSQHSRKYASYTALLSTSDKDAFFSTPAVPYVHTLNAVFESETAVTFTIQSEIVETIIGCLLFHPDDVEGASHARAMSIFKKIGNNYEVQETNPSRFRLCVRFMSRGASFRMAAKLMDDTKEETGIGRFAGCSEGIAARYARLVCAASLERLSMCIDQAWAY